MRLPWGPRGWQESGTRASVADSIDSDVSEEGHRRFHTAPARYGVRSGQLKRRSLPPIWEVADRFHEEPDRSAIDDPSAASQRRERLRDEAQSSACAFLQRERDLLARLPQSIGRGGSGADKLWSEVADFKREALAERARLQRLCQASDIAGRRGTEPPLESLLAEDPTVTAFDLSLQHSLLFEELLRYQEAASGAAEQPELPPGHPMLRARAAQCMPLLPLSPPVLPTAASPVNENGDNDIFEMDS